MKKSTKRLLQYTLVLLFILTATGVSAQLFGRETYVTYYLDDAYLDYAGEHDIFCDGGTYDDGGYGSWRVYDQYSCRTGARVVHRCQQTDGVGGWITMTCPPNQP
ncbi:MAG TPA: hypothetical protein VJZ00_02680 [Thermoanaerobaculia bacterium]|nr:hypothetical protein [Thermoanaerobaculia bacterium]